MGMYFSLLHHVQTVSGAWPPSYPLSTAGPFPWGWTGRGVKLTTRFLLLSRLGIRGLLLPLPPYVFMSRCFKHTDCFTFLLTVGIRVYCCSVWAWYYTLSDLGNICTISEDRMSLLICWLLSCLHGTRITSLACSVWEISSETMTPFRRFDRTLWTGELPIPYLNMTAQHRKTHTSMPRAEFEPTIPVFERSKSIRDQWDQLVTLLSSVIQLEPGWPNHYND
jgi:hypothetical protein